VARADDDDTVLLTSSHLPKATGLECGAPSAIAPDNPSMPPHEARIRSDGTLLLFMSPPSRRLLLLAGMDIACKAVSLHKISFARQAAGATQDNIHLRVREALGDLMPNRLRFILPHVGIVADFNI
jgi:hypothetical protein